MSLWQDFKPKSSYPRRLREEMLKRNSQLDESTLDLLDALLQLNPDKRMTASQALNHQFFKCAVSRPYLGPTTARKS